MNRKQWDITYCVAPSTSCGPEAKLGKLVSFFVSKRGDLENSHTGRGLRTWWIKIAGCFLPQKQWTYKVPIFSSQKYMYIFT